MTEPALPAPDTMPAPAMPAMPGMEPAPSVPAEPTSTSAPTPENSGVVTVWLPFDAKVTINGRATSSTGSRRQFVSYGLKPGYSYKYVIHAEVETDGNTLESDRTVTLTAGSNTSVAFGVIQNPAADLASAN
jgi:uncharacterized protein (TIGR03000 family)